MLYIYIWLLLCGAYVRFCVPTYRTVLLPELRKVPIDDAYMAQYMPKSFCVLSHEHKSSPARGYMQLVVESQVHSGFIVVDSMMKILDYGSDHMLAIWAADGVLRYMYIYTNIYIFFIYIYIYRPFGLCLVYLHSLCFFFPTTLGSL